VCTKAHDRITLRIPTPAEQAFGQTAATAGLDENITDGGQASDAGRQQHDVGTGARRVFAAGVLSGQLLVHGPDNEPRPDQINGGGGIPESERYNCPIAL